MYDREAVRKYQAKKAALLDCLKSSPCLDCGFVGDPCQMDFDHLSDKSFNIMRGHTVGLERLLLELEKCEVVCANCHRLRTKRRKEACIQSST